MRHELKKKVFVDPGSTGRPSWYPEPDQDDDLLFYIQRNQNEDAIVYRVNRTSGGLISRDLPMDAYWIKFTNGGERRELNAIQSKLAYGYESEMISPELFRFRFVAYKSLQFYIAKKEDQYIAQCEMEGEIVQLDNIYVYALEFGVFPDVKYIELYGERADGTFAYRKIDVE
ncbi:MAG: DUF4833 domain-containing protein [Bacteroidota bacterium]